MNKEVPEQAGDDSRQVLVIDDDSADRLVFQELVQSLGFHCLVAEDGDSGLRLLRENACDILLTDLQMPGKDGFTVLKEALEWDPILPVIMITGMASIEKAVEAIRLGAHDFIPKPLERHHLEVGLRRALAYRQLQEQNLELRRRLELRDGFSRIVGQSRMMRSVFSLIERAAPVDTSILVYGESGTGKELVARAVHANSSRRAKEFVALDCVALPSNLIESELFGHEKGAFTGADQRRIGLLETAHGGTLFLDEVTELDPSLQAKLLRVLQERQFRRIGGRELIDLDIRILAATRREPLQAVKDGLFREDLYYRLAVIPIQLPPLRERSSDIPLLIGAFLEEFGERLPRIPEFSGEVIAALQQYAWPGNVRELKNMVERLCVLTVGTTVCMRDLPPEIRGNAGAEEDRNTSAEVAGIRPFTEVKNKIINDFEIRYLQKLLAQFNGNLSQAAKTAGVDRKTLHRLCQKHGVRGKLENRMRN